MKSLSGLAGEIRSVGDIAARDERRKFRVRLVLLWLTAWYVGAYIFRASQDFVLPFPHELLALVGQAWFSGIGWAGDGEDVLHLPMHTILTMLPWGIGTLIGAMSARLVALLFGESRYFRWTVWPSIMALYMLPLFAIAPIIGKVMAEIGYALWVPKIATAFLAAFPVVLMRMMPEMQMQSNRIELLDSMGATGNQIADTLLWPAGRQVFYSSLAMACGASLFTVIFCELPMWNYGTGAGLGGLLMVGFQPDVPDVVSWIALFMIGAMALIVKMLLPLLLYYRMKHYHRMEIGDAV